ncbi:MAG: YcxB family protein [Desulfuromusa sp.]|jgi:hypothetical protein|nr:YcxB family protein [Desulfuromusa sp.]
MKIKYEVGLEDFFVFSNYLINASPLMLKTIRKGQMWWACGPLVGGLMFAMLRGYSPEKTLMVLSMLSVAMSLPMFFMYRRYFEYRNQKQIKTLYKNDSYKGVVGTHEMTISDESLTDKTEHSDSQIQWNLINKIATTADHTFIFTDDVTAYIIPHKKIKGSKVPQFLTKLDDVFKKTAN